MYPVAVARTVETRVEIDAPAARVWQFLVDVAAYPRWNPWTLRVSGELGPGGTIELLTQFYEVTGPRRELAVIGRWEPGRELQWEVRRGPTWLLRRVRVQRVEPLSTGGCRYLSEDTYHGLLAPAAEWLERGALRRAAERMAAALKQRAEAAPPEQRPEVTTEPEEDDKPLIVSQQVRDTFVLRGRFVAPPAAPPSASPPDALAQMLAGYDRGITTYQSPTRRDPVDKSEWQPCHACARSIPAAIEWRRDVPGALVVTSITYVCPRCHATQLGVERHFDRYDACHVCEAPLGDALACPRCGMLRYWTCVACPTCGASQPVLARHLGSHCDVFYLECVECETAYSSLCIC